MRARAGIHVIVSVATQRARHRAYEECRKLARMRAQCADEKITVCGGGRLSSELVV